MHIDSNHPDKEEKNFFCDHCTNSYIYKDSLKKHKDALKERERYKPKINIKCDYCMEFFTSTYTVKSHYTVEHPNKPMILPGHKRYTCEHCDAFYFEEHCLKKHFYKIHQSSESKKQLSSIPCDYCNEKFTNSFFLKKHYKNLHPGQPIIANAKNRHDCTKCRDFFFWKHELNAHLNLEHGVEMEHKYCKICRQPYKKVHTCGLLKQKDKPEQKYLCSECPREFTKPVYLKNHVKSVHENRLDYKCEQCRKKFVSKHMLTSHIFQTHSSQVNCGICNKTISNPQQLKRHMVFSHNETEGAIFCVQCPKSVFFKESTFKTHMETKHDIFE